MQVNFFSPAAVYGSHDFPIYIGALTLGRVVQFTTFEEGRKVADPKRFGHIAGFDTNTRAELLIRVQVRSDIISVHPANLILL